MTPRILIALTALLSCPLAISQIPADIELVPAFGGETFLSPIGVRHANDGSDRKFIIERNGRIQIVDDANEVAGKPFLDISSEVSTTFEGGFLGLAFHPDYSSNGRFYVKYTYLEPANPDLITRVAEFQVSAGDPDLADSDSERIILEIQQDSNNHNGGDLHFGADGYLYFGMGDGGDRDDPCDRGQGLDPSATPPSSGCAPGPRGWLLGKMIRIDVDNTTPPGSNNLCAANPDGSAEYALPVNNPFVGETDRCGEVWAYGVRNPYRFSFDRETGDLWIGDVGQDTWEEVDLLAFGDPNGANLGWKVCEGSFLRGSTNQACNLAGHTAPVLEYSSSGSPCRSVTGGFRYRGPVQSLDEYYVYSDYCSGDIWFASEDGGGNWDSEFFQTVATGGFGNHSGYGEDEQGNLYLTLLTGSIFVFNGDRITDPVFNDRFEN